MDETTKPNYLRLVRSAVVLPTVLWVVIISIMLLFYAVSAAAPMLGTVQWQDAARFASGWWLSIFGANQQIDETAIGIIPLTLTLLTGWIAYRLFSKHEISTWQEVGIAAGTPTAVVLILALATRPDGTWWPALFGSAALFGIAALASAHEQLLAAYPAYQFLRAVRQPLRWMVVVFGGLVAVTAVLMLLLGAARIGDIHSSYLAGVDGVIGLALLQLSYIPNLLAWVAAWLLGPGFAIGANTNFSALGTTAGPLPAFPILGALPQVGTKVPAVLALVAVLALIAGAVRTWRLTKQDDAVTPLAALTSRTAVAGVVLALGNAVWALLSGGAIGPGRMAEIGPRPELIFLATLGLIAAPFLLGAVTAHPTTIAYVQRQKTQAVAAVQNRSKSQKKSANPEAAGSTDIGDDAGADTGNG
ncbi:MAG: DUF6350 family protein [Trueperella sp.]|nr:DUF6350 family protein [Trueperella sp.]